MTTANCELETMLDALAVWFKENPKLPEQINRLLLKRFFKCMSYDMEATKRLIEINYALRHKNPHIFYDRDPDAESISKTIEYIDMAPLPGLTSEGNKLLFSRLADYDPSKLNSLAECQIFFMMADSRFTMSDLHIDSAGNSTIIDTRTSTITDTNNDNDNAMDTDMAAGDIQIIDIAGYTMSHIARISFFTLRTYMKFLQEAYPVKLKAVHVINCPSYLDKMLTIVRPFINDDVYKMIHFHKDGLDSLYEHVPRDMLPEEYGGKAGKLLDIKAQWIGIMRGKRDYLMNAEHWKLPEGSKSSWWFF